MKAVTLTSFSGPEAVAIAEVDPPSIGRNDVLVNVEVAAIGPWDLKTLWGDFAAITRHLPLPQVLGWDFAGTVAGAGPGVTGFAEGDAVLGFSPQLFRGVGAFAEQVVVDATLIALRPPDLSPAQAATLPVCALTAQTLLDRAALRPGDRVLILGAAGAVGGFAARLAQDVNARLGNSEHCRSRGPARPGRPRDRPEDRSRYTRHRTVRPGPRPRRIESLTDRHSADPGQRQADLGRA